MVPGTYLKNLVKIGSVTAEMFLIWTNVTRTNVARTNVTFIVGICSRALIVFGVIVKTILDSEKPLTSLKCSVLCVKSSVPGGWVTGWVGGSGENKANISL